MITFELFKQILDEAKRYHNLSDKMYEISCGGIDLFNIYGAENGQYTPELFLVCALEKICEDNYGVIGNWAFECNFGEEAVEINDIKIETIEELYSYIKGEAKNC